MNNVLYQLHGLCDASNLAFACAIYFCNLVNGFPESGFSVGKSRLVLTCQSGWVISRKEPEAAVVK